MAIAILSMFFAAHPAPESWYFTYGLGGVFGDNALGLILELEIIEINLWLKITTIGLAVSTVALLAYTMGMTLSD